MKSRCMVCVGLLFLATPLTAQDRPVEFGIDAGFTLLIPDQEGSNNLKILSLPNTSYLGMTSIRIGFFVSPRIAFEPVVSIVRMSGGNGSNTSVFLFPSLLYHFKDFDRVPLPYVRVGAGLNYQGSSWDGGGSESEIQFGLGGGVGVKIPFAETAFFRLEAGFDKWLEKGNREDWEDFVPGYSAVKLSAGISAIIN